LWAGTCEENGNGSNGEKDDGRLYTGRRKERPRLRWMDDVVADLRVMKIKQCTEKTKYREQWRLVLRKSSANF
jgi:hypothetical protein